MNVSEMMRRDWDDRARRDAFHYIASWKQDWSIESFLASGEKDYATLVSPVLERCGISVNGEVMVELGCGAGRMTSNFGRRLDTWWLSIYQRRCCSGPAKSMRRSKTFYGYAWPERILRVCEAGRRFSV